MPIENILFLSLVISAFAVFAASLSYAEWVSKQPPKKIVTRAGASETVQRAGTNYRKAA